MAQFVRAHLAIAQLQLQGQMTSILGRQVLVAGKAALQTLRLLRCEAHLAALALGVAAARKDVARVRVRIVRPQTR